MVLISRLIQSARLFRPGASRRYPRLMSPRYLVEWSARAGAWRIWDGLFRCWCHLADEHGADQLTFRSRADADTWVSGCYQAWGYTPQVGDIHAGDRELGLLDVLAAGMSMDSRTAI